MDFISNQEEQINEMLKAIGIADIDALFADIPPNLKLARPGEDDGLSEYEGMRLMEGLAAKNTFPEFVSYLGGGAYEHHVPAIVASICSKAQFLTSYTPYQAEASQGMLQAIFEFQSAICALTGLDVANASLYDGASACAEAILMTLRINKDRNQIVITQSLHPHYRSVIEQFVGCHGTQIDFIPYNPEDGRLDKKAMLKLINDKTAAVLVQSPNFFGVIEDVAAVSAEAKKAGALCILNANPLSYALYTSAAEQGVDIAVGDVQPLGLPLQFGGPYAGYMACREALVRQVPGRIVGATIDKEGRNGFVLTLQAREQHIRREKATSNICTNQALAALASLVAIWWYGKEGMRKLAMTNYQRTAYLRNSLKAVPHCKLFGDAPFFNEFAINFGKPVEEVFQKFRQQGIEPGIDLGRFYPELNGYILVAVTETKSKAELNRFVYTAES
jgi:glycine dehydrogenase subunit 1